MGSRWIQRETVNGDGWRSTGNQSRPPTMDSMENFPVKQTQYITTATTTLHNATVVSISGRARRRGVRLRGDGGGLEVRARRGARLLAAHARGAHQLGRGRTPHGLRRRHAQVRVQRDLRRGTNIGSELSYS